MKIQFASDLHLEFLDSRFPGYRIVEPTDADVLVLAGDIHHAARTIDVFADWPVPVIYVHGNHELYRQQIDAAIADLRTASRGSNVHVLEEESLILNGVRFLGCCLWTDYRLYPGQETAAMQEAEQRLTDHRAIHNGDRFFTAQDALQRHEHSRAWLTQQLLQPFAGKTVVVTHHAPHPRSIHARYEGSLVNAGFASDLASLVAQSDLWIHGHVHDSFDYIAEGTRVVANPRGYARNRMTAQTVNELAWENPHFNACRLAEI